LWHLLIAVGPRVLTEVLALGL